MFEFTARNLLRALDVAAFPARNCDFSLPVLCQIPLEFTDKGLIAYSTDRYQLVRTLAPYSGDAPEHGAPEARITWADLKTLLPVLKAGKDSPVTVSVTTDAVLFECGPQAVRLENHAGERDYPKIASLFRLHEGPNVPLVADPFFALNPAFLHQLSTMLKRYGDRHAAAHFSLSRKDAAQPLAWMMGDWAHGLIMPVRPGAPRTAKVEAEAAEGGLTRLFDAVPLPQGPGAAEVAEVETATAEPVPAGA